MVLQLSINFPPNAIYKPERRIRTILDVAKSFHFSIVQIICETVEGEEVEDGKWLAEISREYKRIGFTTAIADFDTGFADLNLLADYQRRCAHS